MKSHSSRAAVVLMMVCLLAFVVGTAAGQSICIGSEEYFDIYCGYECNYHNGTWGCYNENPNRCCWDHVQGNSCGEGAKMECPECEPGGCSF